MEIHPPVYPTDLRWYLSPVHFLFCIYYSIIIKCHFAYKIFLPSCQVLFGSAFKSGALVAEPPVCAKGIFQAAVFVSSANTRVIKVVWGQAFA